MADRQLANGGGQADPAGLQHHQRGRLPHLLHLLRALQEADPGGVHLQHRVQGACAGGAGPGEESQAGDEGLCGGEYTLIFKHNNLLSSSVLPLSLFIF